MTERLLKAALNPIQTNPLPEDKILDWSKLKAVTDDHFKLMKFEKKTSKFVELISPAENILFVNGVFKT